MRKKTVFCIALLSSLALGGLFACSTTPSDPNTLNIICLDAGYGTTWINTIVSKWEEANPDYKVNLQASYEASSLIQKHLASSSNDDDLYISVGAEWKTYASQGKFAELDDLLDEKVDGVSVKEKVSDEFSSSLSFEGPNKTKHAYRLPWTRGIGGIYYNKKIIDQVEGWENRTPETFDELLQLVSDIKDAGLTIGKTTVKPFVYTGANTDYFDYTVLTWWGQLAGVENISKFLEYPSADVFDYTKADGCYDELKTAVEMWNQIFGDSTNYVDGSLSKSNHDAQKDFMNGYSAMIMDGDWIYNEMLKYNTETGTLPASMDLRMMATPVADGAVDSNAYYVVGDDQYIAVPATSTKKALAESFIKTIISNEGCKTFVEQAHGFLAYDYDVTSSDDVFMASEIKVRNAMGDCYTKYSSNALYLTGFVDIWGTSAMRPFSSILQGSTIDTAFSTIKSETARNWETWKKQAGITD